jgi:hypothetical protein
MEQRNKRIGVLIMFFGFVICCFFIWFFKLSGQIVDFTNLGLVLKFMFASAFMPLGLYVGLLFYGDKKVAVQLGGGLGLLLVLSYVVGFLLHH